MFITRPLTFTTADILCSHFLAYAFTFACLQLLINFTHFTVSARLFYLPVLHKLCKTWSLKSLSAKAKEDIRKPQIHHNHLLFYWKCPKSLVDYYGKGGKKCSVCDLSTRRVRREEEEGVGRKSWAQNEGEAEEGRGRVSGWSSRSS